MTPFSLSLFPALFSRRETIMKLATLVILCGLSQILLCWTLVEALDGNQVNFIAADVLFRRDGLPLNSQSSSKRKTVGEPSRPIRLGVHEVTNQPPIQERHSDSPTRRSTRSDASSSGTSISAATPSSSSSSGSSWSELRHQKSWTSSSDSDSSTGSMKSTKSSKRTSRSGATSSPRPLSRKSSSKSLGALAIDGHSSDSSGDSAEYNSMLHKARKLGFTTIRTDDSLTSWSRMKALSRYGRTLSRSPGHRARSPTRSPSPASQSRHSAPRSNSDSETSSHSSRAKKIVTIYKYTVRMNERKEKKKYIQ
ncbi:uncharacterized protein FA14DRAFT_65834 [Meira miltonrushii]|uniref:Uncharacterized protein n=1 Tax=Meira miltonrushii TaxID=1280837 RepID=A0A316V9D3_9BASI|nr:uncharacterized protein FA14DRAFT_65834 [Meira miltonrushii]PWN33854.1 hypothetical protein FA14DRAFT_65834 [Meira miltonrushii]